MTQHRAQNATGHMSKHADRSPTGRRSVGLSAAELQRHARAGIVVTQGAQLAAVAPWHDDPAPPGLLCRLGAPVDLSRRRVGIVGTRGCTAYGRKVAGMLGRELAQAGVTVVSGLAKGIDGFAQRAALDAGGTVVGVVASGLDVVYPPQHAQLWNDIARHGTLLSEYPLGEPALQWHFPARNRLIAALSEVIVVVESRATGGSFHTVDAALARSRPVMAVPGNITNITSQGTNRLIAEGCEIARSTSDVLIALGLVQGAASLFSPPPAAADRTPGHAQDSAPDRAQQRGRAKRSIRPAVGSGSTAGVDPAVGAGLSLASGAAAAAGLNALTDCGAADASDHATADAGPAAGLDAAVLAELDSEPCTVDELVAHTGAELAAVTAALGRLHRAGQVAESLGWWERT